MVGPRPFFPPSPPPPPNRGGEPTYETQQLLMARAASMTAPMPPVPPITERRAEELMERARLLEAKGDRAAAAAVLKRAAKAPSHASIALIEAGRIERRRGRRHEALAHYKRSLHYLEDSRQIAWVYAEIGQLYFAMREDEEAAYYFRRAAGLDPRHAALCERTSAETAVPDIHDLDTSDIELVTLQ